MLTSICDVAVGSSISSDLMAVGSGDDEGGGSGVLVAVGSGLEVLVGDG